MVLALGLLEICRACSVYRVTGLAGLCKKKRKKKLIYTPEPCSPKGSNTAGKAVYRCHDSMQSCLLLPEPGPDSAQVGPHLTRLGDSSSRVWITTCFIYMTTAKISPQKFCLHGSFSFIFLSVLFKHKVSCVINCKWGHKSDFHLSSDALCFALI